MLYRFISSRDEVDNREACLLLAAETRGSVEPEAG